MQDYLSLRSTDPAVTVMRGRFLHDAPRRQGRLRAEPSQSGLAVVEVAPEKRESYSLTLRFIGERLGPGAAAQPLDTVVTVEIACILDTWCGAEPPQTPVVVPVTEQGAGLHVRMSPCQVWAAPEQEDLVAPLLACHLEGVCD